ncbi:MAG TPA: VOC family protein [Gammaproteobacteria bacterium]|nr:VOC family protein [Gammaproteobacteria bacterium]
MRLAKPAFDVGLFTNRLEPMLDFWQQEVGLGLDHMQPLGGGVRQHRHRLPGQGVLKLNHARDPLPGAPPSGYSELLIARDGLNEPVPLEDPDGNRVILLPRGTLGVTGFGMRVLAGDVAAHRAFFAGALGLSSLPGNADAWRCGNALLLLEHSTRAVQDAPLQAPGYRYVTFQVHDCDAAHAAVLTHGGREGQPPGTLGEVARISFVRDPDGNWIEVSQRASLTGPLPA